MKKQPYHSPIHVIVLSIFTVILVILGTGIGMMKETTDSVAHSYEEGYVQLENGRSEAEKQLGDAEKQIKDGEEELTEGRKELDAAETELAAAEKELAAGEQELIEGHRLLTEADAELNNGETELVTASMELNKGLLELQNGEQALNQGKIALAEGEATYAYEKANAEKQLAAGLAELQKGENDLAEGREAVATGQNTIAVIQGVRNGAPAVSGALSNPAGYFADYASYFPGAATWEDYLGMAEAYAAAGNGNTETMVESTRQALIEQEMANQEGTIQQLTDQEMVNQEGTIQQLTEQEMANQEGTIQQLTEQEMKNQQAYITQLVNEELAKIAASEGPFIIDGTEYNKNTYMFIVGLQIRKEITAAVQASVCEEITAAVRAGVREEVINVVRPQVREEVIKGVRAQVETGVNESLLALGNGVIDGSTTVFDTILAQTADLPVLINGIIGFDPGLADSLAPMQAVLNMPQGGVYEKLAKSRALAATMNSPEFLGLLQGVESSVQQSVDAGLAEIAKGEQDLKAGWNEYHRQKAEADRLLAEGRAELEAGRKEIQVSEIALAEGRAAYESGLQDYREGKVAYDEGMALYLEKKAEYDNGLAAYQEGKAAYEQGKQEYKSGLKEYETGYQELMDGKEEYKTAHAAADKQLADGETALESAESLLGMTGADIQTGVKGNGIPYANVSNGMGSVLGGYMLVAALLLIFCLLLISIRTFKRNTGIVSEMRKQGHSNMYIAGRLTMVFSVAAVLASLVGIALGFPLVKTLMNVVSGGALEEIGTTLPLFTGVGLIAVVLISAVAGSLLSSMRLNKLITRE